MSQYLLFIHYRVKVSLYNQDGLFKPGMPAEAKLQAAETVK